jgi:hypothetical protein
VNRFPNSVLVAISYFDEGTRSLLTTVVSLLADTTAVKMGASERIVGLAQKASGRMNEMNSLEGELVLRASPGTPGFGATSEARKCGHQHYFL